MTTTLVMVSVNHSLDGIWNHLEGKHLGTPVRDVLVSEHTYDCVENFSCDLQLLQGPAAITTLL